jgi:hypothetical protein
MLLLIIPAIATGLAVVASQLNQRDGPRSRTSEDGGRTGRHAWQAISI